MRIRHFMVFLAAAALTFAGQTAATPSRKKPAAGKTSIKTARKSSVSTRKTKGGASKPGASRSVSAASSSWRTHQQAPTPERYREIQQALVAKGYLKADPTGVWDADSAEAMRRFQTDQKLAPTGKINAPSLIGLGLGGSNTPGTATGPAVVPDPPPPPGEAGPLSPTPLSQR